MNGLTDIWAKIWTFAGRKAYGLILQGSAWIFCWPVVRSGLMKLDLSSWYEDLRGECNYEQLHHIRVIPCEAPVLENIPGWITKSCLSSSIQDVSWPKTVTTFAASNWETIHLKTVILSSSPNTYTYQEKNRRRNSQPKEVSFQKKAFSIFTCCQCSYFCLSIHWSQQSPCSSLVQN